MNLISLLGYPTKDDLKQFVQNAQNKGQCTSTIRRGHTVTTQVFTFKNPQSIAKVERVISSLWLPIFRVWSVAPVFKGVSGTPIGSTRTLQSQQPDVLQVEISTTTNDAVLTILRLNKDGSGEEAFMRV
jgi:hypothetical protein